MEGKIKLELSPEQLRTLTNALNEVLNGPEAVDEAEFHTRLGVTRDQAAALLDQLQQNQV